MGVAYGFGTVFLSAYQGNQAKGAAQRQLAGQRLIDISLAESSLGQAQAAAGYSHEYADRVMEVAGKRLALAQNQSAFTRVQGEYAEMRGDTLHDVLDAQALTTEAIGQRAAIAEQKEAENLASSGQALTGAGGLVSEDTNRIIAEVEADGEYNALVRLWEGDDAAAGQRYQGDIAKHEGEVANKIAQYNAAVQLVQADLQYEESGILADNARFNAEQEVANAQSQLDALRGT